VTIKLKGKCDERNMLNRKLHYLYKKSRSCPLVSLDQSKTAKENGAAVPKFREQVSSKELLQKQGK